MRDDLFEPANAAPSGTSTPLGRMPDFLIIGAQRSSTTLLHHCLDDHPQIMLPAEEIPFFEKESFDKTPLEEFQASFSGATHGQLLGIKRPSYLALPDCAHRIHSLVPEAKLIAVLRDPVDRAIAAYYHNVLNGFVPCVPIEKGMPKLLAGRWQARYPRSWEIIEFGFYGRQLALYQELFGPTRILVLYYDDMRNRTLETVQRCYRFLGVDDDFVPRSLDGSFQRGIYALPRLRLRAWSNRFRFSYDEGGTRLSPKSQSGLDRAALRMFEGLERTLLPDAPERQPTLPGALRQQLIELYAPDVGLLSGLDGVPQPPWQTFAAAAPSAPRPDSGGSGSMPTQHVVLWLAGRLALSGARHARRQLSPLRIQYVVRRRLGLLDMRSRLRLGRRG